MLSLQDFIQVCVVAKLAVDTVCRCGPAVDYITMQFKVLIYLLLTYTKPNPSFQQLAFVFKRKLNNTMVHHQIMYFRKLLKCFILDKHSCNRPETITQIILQSSIGLLSKNDPVISFLIMHRSNQKF